MYPFDSDFASRPGPPGTTSEWSDTTREPRTLDIGLRGLGTRGPRPARVTVSGQGQDRKDSSVVLETHVSSVWEEGTDSYPPRPDSLGLSEGPSRHPGVVRYRPRVGVVRPSAGASCLVRGPPEVQGQGRRTGT